MPGRISLVLTVLACSAVAQSQGPQIYQTNCARCHDTAKVQRIPSRSALEQLPSAAIVNALTSGVMREQGSHLTPEERNAVADWLSQAAPTLAAKPETCQGQLSASGSNWPNWGNELDNARYETNPGFPASEVPRLKLKWAYGVPNAKAMRSQPAVYKGIIYLGAEHGPLVALDAATGCLRWSAPVKGVRSAISIGRAAGVEALFYGDATGTEHAVALADGRELWNKKIADHPTAVITGASAYHDGRLYVPLASYEEVAVLSPGYRCCSFRGSVTALDTAAGTVVWQSHTIDQAGSSGAAIWSTPTLDPAHHVLYVTTGDNYSEPATETSDAVLAFDLKTGKRLWSRQFTKGDAYNVKALGPGKDYDFGAPPILVNLVGGKRALLLSEKSGMVYAVDPDAEGKLLWEARAGRGGALGGIEWGAASDGHAFYVALSDAVLGVDGKPPKLVLNSKAGGGLIAYEAVTGKVLWKAPPPVCSPERLLCSPAQSAPVSAMPGVVFSGSLDGHLRAYSTADGKVLWDFDSERSFDTVNQVPASGGSLDVAGPVIADGMVFVESGYPQWGGKGGNVLLAFRPE